MNNFFRSILYFFTFIFHYVTCYII